MYEDFYGFRERPFHVTADPAFIYPSQHHQEAMAHLTYGIQQRLGFLVITGEVGTGKTTLAKALVEQLQAPTKTALILNPALSASQLLRAILRDFGGQQNGHSKVSTMRGQLLEAIERFLLEQADLGAAVVLIIDEAQALSTSALENVRLLSNVETPKAKLLQIVLVGQPELDQRLNADPRLRALRQRIAIRYHIPPLDENEVAAYIQHRIQIAGAKHAPRFTGEAITSIARTSQGIPGRINRICDQALLAGFIRESYVIDETMVKEGQTSISTEEIPHEAGFIKLGDKLS